MQTSRRTSPDTASIPSSRTGRPQRYLMCPPVFFDIVYAINPWMRPGTPVDHGLVMRQWENLRDTYRRLGHEVHQIEPAEGLPDMVFAANGAVAIGKTVLSARFRHPQRRGEEEHYRQWFADNGYSDVRTATHSNEGEGDFAIAGPWILAGTGFRTDPTAHAETQEIFGRPVISLRLVDPRFYHLDTALCVLEENDIMYFPGAFSSGSRDVLRRMFPSALIATEDDASVLGLNAVSDGRNVVLPAPATDLANRLRERGYRPIPVDLSELLKAGGSVKCCTLQLHDCPA